MAGRTVEKETFGIVVYKAMTRVNALQILNSDPAFQKKLMTAELHEFSLALLNKN